VESHAHVKALGVQLIWNMAPMNYFFSPQFHFFTTSDLPWLFSERRQQNQGKSA
jgi:hypothetical protein